jgi:AcrR family transcriptional regulator
MLAKPDSRQRLIDAAVEVIATKGESALRLTEVAEMAGLKQPSIHYMFPTREDLVVAALRERYRRSVLEAIISYDVLVATATTREEFIRASSLGLRFAMDETRKVARSTRLALFVKAETNAELLREINDASFEANQSLAAVIENAQRRGWVRDDVSPLTLAVWTRGQILGRYVLEMDSTRYDGEEWTRFAITAIEAAVFGSTNKLNP